VRGQSRNKDCAGRKASGLFGKEIVAVCWDRCTSGDVEYEKSLAGLCRCRGAEDWEVDEM
jgi:hypothetical protein